MSSPLGAEPRSGKISILSAFCAIILAIGLMNHVMVIPPLLQEAKPDAWLSVLSALVPFLVWSSVLYFVMKRTNQQPLLPWLRQHCGAAVCGAIRCFFAVYLLLIGTLTLKDTTVWTHASYLPRTPIVALAGTLILLSGWAAYAGIRAIAISSGFLLPFVIVFGDFVMSANLPKKNYSLLTPILENGVPPVLKGTLYIGGGLAELLVLLLLQHRLKTKVRVGSVWLLSVFLVLLILGPVTGAIAEFGPFEAAELRYPAFEEWRLVSIGKYIRHVDFLSIHQWLSGAFVRISLAVFLLDDLLGSKRTKKSKAIGIASVCLAMFVLAVLPISDMQYLAFLKNYYLPGSLMASTGALVVLLLAVLVSRKTKEGAHDS
ncbi:GerAB/ArcD/ProY family transporter [Cohnella caldifontis]|uniref:GerAB/ArcD/ProY family transporter n=1 Tax=Cohnella caldifontis TaxID=3027471 RepID=UPI0023EC5B5C|nr:endospore germination permease [Cohnella sp. YIM B05605]